MLIHEIEDSLSSQSPTRRQILYAGGMSLAGLALQDSFGVSQAGEAEDAKPDKYTVRFERAKTAAYWTPDNVVKKPQVIWDKVIWDKRPAPYYCLPCPGMTRFQGKWFVAIREAKVHGIGGHGKTRVIVSKDDECNEWESVVYLDHNGDFCKPGLSVTADGRLMLINRLNPYLDKDEGDEPYKGRIGKGSTFVSFSADGRRWTDLQEITAEHHRSKKPHKDVWFYTGLTPYRGKEYGFCRQCRTLYRTQGNHQFKVVSRPPTSNETALAFLPNGDLIAFSRSGMICTSTPPYAKWNSDETNVLGRSYGGPNVIALPDGRIWMACRGEGGTALYRLEFNDLHKKPKRLKHLLSLPGTRDRGYNAMAWHDGHLWLCYNSTSPKGSVARNGNPWLAKIKLPD